MVLTWPRILGLMSLLLIKTACMRIGTMVLNRLGITLPAYLNTGCKNIKLTVLNYRIVMAYVPMWHKHLLRTSNTTTIMV